MLVLTSVEQRQRQQLCIGVDGGSATVVTHVGEGPARATMADAMDVKHVMAFMEARAAGGEATAAVTAAAKRQQA